MDYVSVEHQQFVADMEKAGFEVEYYEGRNFWKGPAVRCEDFAEVMALTQVVCQVDEMGTRYIVYPRAQDYGLSKEKGPRSAAKHDLGPFEQVKKKGAFCLLMG